MTESAKSSGLPMTARWDPQRIQEEEATLKGLAGKPLAERVRGYFKLTGPAWMQSAMTLGAGSAAASVVAGAFYGYRLLWVQPIAMILGVSMMAALANITLTRGERGYLIVKREIHGSIAFLWALATIVSTVIWHFGQYALLGGAAWDLALVAGVRNPVDPATGEITSRTVETFVRFAAGFCILAINIYLTWNYGSKPKGIRLYESFLRWMIRLVMLSFLVVAITQAIGGKLNLGGIFRGFLSFDWPVDDPATPADESATLTILGAIGAAVGINMTFLYPYSILAKGWGKHHKGLARFDLTTSLFVPYVILTSLIIVGMASTVWNVEAGYGTILGSNPTPQSFKPIEASQALAGLLGTVGRVVFDLGFMGMACGAISAHMVCCGFTVSEMFGLEYTPARYRWSTLVPAVGLLGVMIASPIWLPVLASALAFTMLPIAYVTFFILQNKRSYLGDAVGRGWRRTVYNVVLLVAVIVSVIGSGIQIKQRVIDKVFSGSPPAAAPSSAPEKPEGE